MNKMIATTLLAGALLLLDAPEAAAHTNRYVTTRRPGATTGWSIDAPSRCLAGCNATSHFVTGISVRASDGIVALGGISCSTFIAGSAATSADTASITTIGRNAISATGVSATACSPGGANTSPQSYWSIETGRPESFRAGFHCARVCCKTGNRFFKQRDAP